MRLYIKDIGKVKLEIQLQWNSFLSLSSKGTNNARSMRSTANIALDYLQVGKKMLAKKSTLLEMYFTIPLSSATAERSTTVLRRLKT